MQLALYNYNRARRRACVPACVRACVGASDCLSMSLFAPRLLAAKMKIARLARGYKRQLAGRVPNVGLAARKGGQVACVLRRTRRLIPPLIYVLIYVLPRVTRRAYIGTHDGFMRRQFCSARQMSRKHKPRQCAALSKVS